MFIIHNNPGEVKIKYEDKDVKVDAIVRCELINIRGGFGLDLKFKDDIEILICSMQDWFDIRLYYENNYSQIVVDNNQVVITGDVKVNKEMGIAEIIAWKWDDQYKDYFELVNIKIKSDLIKEV